MRTHTEVIPYEVHRDDGFVASDDLARIDLDVVHGYLSRSYWSAGIPRETVERAARNSLVFGLYSSGGQVGYARVVTDRASFAYLCDVFVLESYQGRGLGQWMMEALLEHPDLQGLRRFLLATRDAHSLYARYGFQPLGSPASFMERHDPDVYVRNREEGAKGKTR
ncbi:GNAT family N-acetyltransferase [Myxococcus virescens]|uniref:Acetyltransferase (GNAT) domain-containing protein n=1 Tax=Myxococcus virescens TaxID=83456 RepID=A0A511HCW6_9BACT|nr:GNAT family N-acetyltransferase [Myxococcus virescens]GEL71380.1 N-acetyltransferase [Myxococcus virescens]SDE08480.1 Acetyltransferase (GNAT) domain-containing protein [Myxococcus virescens]